MPLAISTDNAQSGWLKIRITGNAVAAGLVGAIANPEGVPLQICESYLYFVAPSTAASTFDIGIGTAIADSSDLVSAFAMNSAAGTVWKVVGTDRASEAAATTPWGSLWPVASFLTATSAAQASTGLIADLFVRYIRLT
jgi:hypothetical protein